MWWRVVLLLCLMWTLAACGFHLRGSQPQDLVVGFRSLYLKADAEAPFATELRKALLANGVALAGDATAAELSLEIGAEQFGKNILSLSGSGRVREYQLYYRVPLRAVDAHGVEWMPSQEIALSRIMAYDDTQVLAKQQEEAQLYRDMRSDAVGQAVRRLARARPHPDVP
ncbi:MAG: LPS assembly lipoprotein LptE [Sideroxydans sp.]